MAANIDLQDDLQHALRYLVVRGALRPMGLISIFASIPCLIHVVAGIYFVVFFSSKILHRLPTVTGIFQSFLAYDLLWIIADLCLVVNGLLLLYSPASIGRFINAANRPFPTMLSRIFTKFVLLGIGLPSTRNYEEYGKLLVHPPSAELLSEAKKLLQQVLKSRAKKSADAFDFESIQFSNSYLWRGLCQNDRVVVVGLQLNIPNRVYLLTRGGIDIDTSQQVRFGRKLKASFNIEGDKYHGVISPECYERFLTWQQGQCPPL